MCGIVGVATTTGRDLSVQRAGLEAMRDRLAHRGPDGTGLWWGGHVALGHRRLAVVGVGDGGAQPMASPCGRHVLVYNGELYNDGEVRASLGVPSPSADRSGSDTRTVLRALAEWGAPGLSRLRGMYALAWYDSLRRVLTLARDPLGIKPLVWWRGPAPGGGQEVVFASEAAAVLAHPHVRAAPDWGVVSAYLTTIRTTLGDRTLFQDVRVVTPGQWIEFDLSGDRIAERRHQTDRPRIGAVPASDGEAVERTRDVVADSVRRHMRSDVPVCALLSGGLDSTIVCAEARRHVGTLRTYCAGASHERGAEPDAAEASPDFAFARLAASRLGARHAEAIISRGAFAERWPWMVDRLGVPLSTPNEVAIHQVAARLRADGHVVALSGEGADELFGGYDRPLSALRDWATDRLGQGRALGPLARDAGEFVLDHAAWTPRDSKPALFRPAMWEAVAHDEGLVAAYRADFESCSHRSGPPGPADGVESLLAAALSHQRRVNLVGLLGRLDGATMLAGVEGRTPLADAQVAAMAECLPMSLKFQPGARPRPTSTGVPPLRGTALMPGAIERSRPATPGARTKIALRRAFEHAVPGEILHRPKASFPLPFQAWLADAIGVLDASTLVESILEPAAIDLVRAAPQRMWNLAWPVLNLAMWGRRWGW